MARLTSDWAKHATQASTVIVGALAVAVLIGWYFHFIPLIQIFPALAPMQRMTALGFLLSAVALSFGGTGRRIAVACALAVLLLAALVCLEYALNADFGIDQLLGRDYVNVHTSNPGRMSPVTALCFLGSSLALLVITTGKLARYASAIVGILASILMAVGIVSVLGYVLGHTETYAWNHFARVAMHTAVAFAVLGAGFLAWAWHDGRVGRGAPEWLPLSLGLGLAAGALGVWQALVAHEESKLPLLSGVILVSGLLGSMLVAIVVGQTQRANKRSRELQASNLMLQQIFDVSPDGLVVTNRQGTILRASENAEKIFGYAPGELSGRPFESLIPEKFQALLSNQRGRFYPQPGTRTMGPDDELLARRRDGSEFPVEIALSPMQAEGEALTLAVIRDVTERKQAQEALRESEERFRSVFEQGPVGVTLMGKDRRMVKVNAAFCQMLGYTEEELTRMTPLDITHPDDWGPSVKLLEQAFQSGISVHRIEKRYVKKSGETLWASLTASVIRDRQGKPVYGMGMIEDISERKRMEEHLRLGHEIIANMEAGLCLVRASDSIVVHANPRFEKMFGYGPEEMVGKHVASLNAPTDKNPEEVAQEIIAELARHGVWRGEILNRRKNGTSFWCSVTVSTFDHPDFGKVWVSIHQDITERKRMEAEIEAGKEQLVASARLSALGMMAGSVAHEINNPLAIIHALASDLMEIVETRGAAPPQVVARDSRRIRETADRIAGIVRSLRQIAREGSSDQSYPTSVSKIVEETLGICKERFRANGIKLLLPASLPKLTVFCREVQIEQGLLNLLQNAFDAVLENPGERSVQLDVSSRAGAVVISVTDSGPGIPPALRSRIMEPFFTTKPVGKGAGLGLSLSKAIAEEHGGKLEYSEDQGRTCFSMVLPLARQAGAA